MQESSKTKLLLAFTLVHIVPREFYEDKLKEAYNYAKEFDPKDTPFIALSLKLNIPVWTEDKDFILYSLQAKSFKALDTKAVEELAEGKDPKEVILNLRKRLTQKPYKNNNS